MITFDWDPAKAASNLSKHGVSFEQARSVFCDEAGVQFDNESHSADEERFLLLGISSTAQRLLVCHCERAGDALVRVIAARKATRRESAFHGQRP